MISSNASTEACSFLANPREYLLAQPVGHQLGVARSDREALRQHHVHVRQQLRKNGHYPPFELFRTAALAGCSRSILDRGAEAVPARQHQPALAQLNTQGMARKSSMARVLARRGTAADIELGDFGDRGRRPEIIEETRGLFDQPAIGGKRIADSSSMTSDGRCASAFCRGRQAGLERRRGQHFEVEAAAFGSAYLLAMTSPCSVMRICP